ncbi:hypothetical protein ACFQY0_20745 [Haloferula chungangensis]|uniref:Uncharacterized protein n=1 Tax=Haloferula chungangensis TaxID=1048331 RepID=A0ABW2LES3_9BACT
MRLLCLLSIVCIGLLASARGGEGGSGLIDEATEIVIGPVFGTDFDPATEHVARIQEKKLIRQVLQSTAGKKPEEIDHYLMLPHLQVAVLNDRGEIIAAFALDRTPAKNSTGSRVVLRTAKVVTNNGKTTIEFGDLFNGFPCKALEPYRTMDKELPETKEVNKPEQDDAYQRPC